MPSVICEIVWPSWFFVVKADNFQELCVRLNNLQVWYMTIETTMKLPVQRTSPWTHYCPHWQQHHLLHHHHSVPINRKGNSKIFCNYISKIILFWCSTLLTDNGKNSNRFWSGTCVWGTYIFNTIIQINLTIFAYSHQMKFNYVYHQMVTDSNLGIKLQFNDICMYISCVGADPGFVVRGGVSRRGVWGPLKVPSWLTE
jgi:hypothetical protein